MILALASSGKEKLSHEFVTAETFAFDWQAGLLLGQTEPISLISSMLFPGFVSTRLGFVSKDLSFSLLFKDSLGLAGLFTVDRKLIYIRQALVEFLYRCSLALFPPGEVVTSLLCVKENVEMSHMSVFLSLGHTLNKLTFTLWYSRSPCQPVRQHLLPGCFSTFHNFLQLLTQQAAHFTLRKIRQSAGLGTFFKQVTYSSHNCFRHRAHHEGLS